MIKIPKYQLINDLHYNNNFQCSLEDELLILNAIVLCGLDFDKISIICGKGNYKNYEEYFYLKLLPLLSNNKNEEEDIKYINRNIDYSIGYEKNENIFTPKIQDIIISKFDTRNNNNNNTMDLLFSNYLINNINELKCNKRRNKDKNKYDIDESFIYGMLCIYIIIIL